MVVSVYRADLDFEFDAAVVHPEFRLDSLGQLRKFYDQEIYNFNATDKS